MGMMKVMWSSSLITEIDLIMGKKVRGTLSFRKVRRLITDALDDI